jgi:hypothetical protein
MALNTQKYPFARTKAVTLDGVSLVIASLTNAEIKAYLIDDTGDAAQVATADEKMRNFICTSLNRAIEKVGEMCVNGKTPDWTIGNLRERLDDAMILWLFGQVCEMHGLKQVAPGELQAAPKS